MTDIMKNGPEAMKKYEADPEARELMQTAAKLVQDAGLTPPAGTANPFAGGAQPQASSRPAAPPRPKRTAPFPRDLSEISDADKSKWTAESKKVERPTRPPPSAARPPPSSRSSSRPPPAGAPPGAAKGPPKSRRSTPFPRDLDDVKPKDDDEKPKESG
mmetsp:Transcript_25111/g.81176  ORF Transcript_25111/g.81176 Transcript_25111/m.81176 type:complete len:159 (+) Transcript_25111:436-912(+)